MSTAQFPSVTADQLNALPDSRRLELIDGCLVAREKSDEAVWIGTQVFSLLGKYVEQHGLGWVFPAGSGFQCFAHGPERVRRVDTAVVLANRMKEASAHSWFVRVCPNLVVEVVSPGDLAYDVHSRIDQWIAAGADEVWLLLPPWRRVRVYDRSNLHPQYDVPQELVAGAGLPGFRCRVADLFPPTSNAGA